MNPTATIGDGGQVTLPSPMRKKLGLRIGDFVVLSFERGRIVIAPKFNSKIPGKKMSSRALRSGPVGVKRSGR